MTYCFDKNFIKKSVIVILFFSVLVLSCGNAAGNSEEQIDIPVTIIKKIESGQNIVNRIYEDVPVSAAGELKLNVEQNIDQLYFIITNSGQQNDRPYISRYNNSSYSRGLAGITVGNERYRQDTEQVVDSVPVLLSGLPQPKNLPELVKNEDRNNLNRQNNQISQAFKYRMNIDNIGDTTDFSDYYGNTLSVLCREVRRINTKNGDKTLNIWVESQGSDQVSDAMIDFVGDSFLKSGTNNDIYDYLTNIFGAEWGEHEFTDQLIAGDDSITILISNIPVEGILGYFDPFNCFKNSYSGINNSHERLMFVINLDYLTNTVNGDGTDDSVWNETDYYAQSIISTLAHEFQHLIHFYQKNTLREANWQNSVFLNEMCSILAEDIIADKLSVPGPRGITGSDPENNNEKIYTGRIPIFNNAPNGSIGKWYDEDERILLNYSTAYAFGAWLIRNYGGAKLLRFIVQNNKSDTFEAIAAAFSDLNYERLTVGQLLFNWAIAQLTSDKTQPKPFRFNWGDKYENFMLDNINYRLGSINLDQYYRMSLKGDIITESGVRQYSGLKDDFSEFDKMEKNSVLIINAGGKSAGSHNWEFAGWNESYSLSVFIK